MAPVPRKELQLVFPSGGLDRSGGYGQQRPYTTPDALNVRPDEQVEGRERGGSRPGIDRYAYESLGADVNMLASVQLVTTDGFINWHDRFDLDSVAGIWSTPAWIGSAPAVLPGEFSLVSYTTGRVGSVRAAYGDFDATSDYSWGAWIVPYLGQNHGDHYLFLRMDDASPDAEEDGVVIRLHLATDGSYSGTLIEYSGGSGTAYDLTAGSPGAVRAGWLVAEVSGDVVTVKWLGTTLLTVTLGTAAGKRIGWGMEATNPGGIILVGEVRHQFYEAADSERYRELLVGSAGGTLYKEGRNGELASFSGTSNLASDHNIQADNSNQKVYAADHAPPRAAGTGGTISGGGNDTLDDAGVSDWTALGIDTANDVVVINNASGPTEGTYKIASVSAGAVTLDGDLGAGGTCTYRIARAPKVIDPVAGTCEILFATAGKGSVPNDCRAIAVWRGRLCFAASPTVPQAWYMSRQDNFHDYSYGESDSKSAVAGPASADAHNVGQPTTALIAFSDDLLVMGCTRSVLMFRGDPAFNGDFKYLSRTIGIVDRQAWCVTPGGQLFFLSHDGIYTLQPGGATYPQEVSRRVLPNELRDVDRDVTTVLMAYDTEFRGIHIFATPVDGASAGKHFWFDLEAGGFWPVSLVSSSFEVTSMCEHKGTPLMGTRGGYVRMFHQDHETDEGTAFDSYVDIGPLRPGGRLRRDGLIHQLDAELAVDSGDVTWSVKVAATPEQAVNASAFVSGTWSQGRNFRVWPRARGGGAIIRLAGAGRRWGVDGMSAVLLQHQVQRKLG